MGVQAASQKQKNAIAGKNIFLAFKELLKYVPAVLIQTQSKSICSNYGQECALIGIKAGILILYWCFKACEIVQNNEKWIKLNKLR